MTGSGNLYGEEQAIAFQNGDEAALAFFFREFHPALSLFAFQWIKRRALAQEIASEAFVKIWRIHWKLNSYSGIRAYLYKTVRRDCQLAVKREERRVQVHLRFNPPKTDNETPFDHLVRSEAYRLIHTALQDLSAGNRKVITMHFLEGKTTGQIARELSLHPHTVQTQKARGLKALRKIIQRSMLLSLSAFVKIFLPLL